SVEAAGGDAQDTAHGAHREVGLVRHHESEDFVEVASLRPANQAVAFARMSRSCCSWRTWRRSRLSSSRSAVLKPSLPGNGLPLSMAAWPTQLVMDCAVTLSSRESSAGARPARTSSTICCLNSAGYGGLTLDIHGSLNTKNDVSTESGQPQHLYHPKHRASHPHPAPIAPKVPRINSIVDCCLKVVGLCALVAIDNLVRS